MGRDETKRNTHNTKVNKRNTTHNTSKYERTTRTGHGIYRTEIAIIKENETRKRTEVQHNLINIIAYPKQIITKNIQITIYVYIYLLLVA